MKSMFKFVLAPVVLAAAALAATPATAESTLKVPFSFTADGKICPAGYYTLEHEGSFVILLRKGSSETFTYLLGPGVSSPNDSKVALNFDKVGNSHVLQSIQYGAAITSRLDKKSMRDAERESNQLTGGR